MIKQGQGWPRFAQNTSVVQSKSSKTIRSKFITSNQQQSKPDLIYFKQDPMRQQIILRAQKQNNKISPKPTIQQDHLGKVSRIVSDLHKRKQQAKKRLENLKQQNQKQLDKIYPFSPIKQKVPKYVVTGDIIRRNQVWLQQKAKKRLNLKQQRTLQQLKHCTFSPHFQAKKQSDAILKSKKSVTPKKSIAKFQDSINQSTFYSPVKSRRKDITNQQYQTAKKYLVSKIMNTTII